MESRPIVKSVPYVSSRDICVLSIHKSLVVYVSQYSGCSFKNVRTTGSKEAQTLLCGALTREPISNDQVVSLSLFFPFLGSTLLSDFHVAGN